MWEAIAFVLETLKSVGKWILGRRVPREEKEMLVRALPSGEIRIVGSDQRGDFVRPGDSSHDHHYYNERDRAVQEKGIETLNALVARGWVRYDKDILYRVTATGFERARTFAKKIKV